MGTLAFFPWLQLGKSLTVNGYTLVPYVRGRQPAGPGSAQQRVLDTILKPYHAVTARPIACATLLKIDDGDLLRDLSEDESDGVFAFAELLAVSGLSRRTFFHPLTLDHYCNKDLFMLVVRTFGEPGGGMSLTCRRRDGSTDITYSDGAYRLVKPAYVVQPMAVEIDKPLLGSLVNAQTKLKLEDWAAIYEAIVNFNAANTDGHFIGKQTEVVFLSGAFERLKDLRRGRVDELAECFLSMLAPRQSVSPQDCPARRNIVLADRYPKCLTVGEAWIRDFFSQRHAYAHGSITSRHSSYWSIDDHLLLASFVFPLLLKKVLQKHQCYQVTEEDQSFINVFEELAREEHCIPWESGHQNRVHPWLRIISNVLRLHEPNEDYPDLNGG